MEATSPLTRRLRARPLVWQRIWKMVHDWIEATDPDRHYTIHITNDQFEIAYVLVCGANTPGQGDDCYIIQVDESGPNEEPVEMWVPDSVIRAMAALTGAGSEQEAHARG